MQLKKAGLPLLFLNFLMVAECSQILSRQNVAGSLLKKEPRSKMGKRALGRGEAFENLFQVYDPSFLAVVWPKISNGVHLLLEVPCWEDSRVFFKDFSDGKAWTYRAVDSSGRYPSAFLSGNRFWLGSKEQCLHMNHIYTTNRSNTSWVGTNEYGLTKASLLSQKNSNDDDIHEWRSEVHENLTQQVIASDEPPYSLAYTTVQVAFNITKPGVTKMSDILIGVCLPQSCDVNDVKSIINFSIMINDRLKSNRTLPRIARITSLRKIESYDFKRDVGAILLISITIVLIVLGVVATAIEIDLVKCLPFNKKSMSFDLERFNNGKNIAVDKENNVIGGVERNGVEKLRTNLASAINIATDLKTINKCYAVPLPVTPEVVFADKKTGCKRCGKYKKQCNNARGINNLSSFPREIQRSAESVATEERSSLFCRLLLCFSLIHSWKRIFNKNTANKDLVLIHVLKIVATFWVIFVHVSVMVDHVSDNSKDINELNNVYYIIMSGTVAFDTLFFVSGLFSSHHFFYLKSRYSVEQLVSFGGACGQILQFVCFVTNRAIRILPTYAYAILLTAVLARMARDTAVLTLPDGDHKNCDSFWWRNILYVSNMYPDNEQCMQVSWFLSTETQLHALGALACAASVSARMFDNMRARLVAALALVLILAATSVDVSLSYIHGGLPFSNAYVAYSAIIVRPWARVAPYFIGVFAGWLVHAMEGRLKVSKITSCILWVLSMCVAAACTWVWWAGAGAGAGAGAIAWLHAPWAGALLWPLLARCSVPSASHTSGAVGVRAGGAVGVVAGRALSALGRVCGGALALHAAAAKLLLLSVDAPLCSRTACVWLYFAGTSLLTVLASLLLSLFLETPCCSLLRRISDCATT